MNKIKVVSYGIGVIGTRIIHQMLGKETFELVGAIDIDPAKVGQDLGDVIKLGRKLNIIISNDVDKILTESKPDIVVHTTRSYVKQVYDEFVGILKHKVNVVSTCEEMSYSYDSEPELTAQLDKIAKENGVTILGTGINPGFLMDFLPLVLTGPCESVEKIEIARKMNASTRRIPFQKKIGAGLTLAEFRNKIDNHIITGHVGLEQSIGLIAAGLGWNLDEIKTEEVKPVVSEPGVASDAITVNPGDACGLEQIAYGIIDGKQVIHLDFRAYLGAEEEYDTIKIEGNPSFHQKITPCVHGDIGTISMTINSIPNVVNGAPGLKTMKDLPPAIVTQ
jgi:2,4-diaminopentanoate dehydrogenase